MSIEIIIVCDKCGIEFKQHEYGSNSELRIEFRSTDSCTERSWIRRDLCHKCTDDLREVLDEFGLNADSREFSNPH